MAFEQTITVINNSGKIISTGKHLASVFKEARAAYREKKDLLRQEQNGGGQRSKSFSRGGYHEPIIEEFDDDGHEDDRRRHHRRGIEGRTPLYLENGSSGRRPQPPRRSSSSSRHHSTAGRRPMLTAGNLRTHSEISATAPSKPIVPRAYRESAADVESLPRVGIVRSRTTPMAGTQGMPGSGFTTPVSTPRQSMMANRSRSDPSLRQRSGSGSVSPTSSGRVVDMNLAYGSVPPDLASRDDLEDLDDDMDDLDDLDDLDDPRAFEGRTEEEKQAKARTLVERIESLLNEAQCIHHTAAATISHLQQNPEAAAAVALTLAELSTLLGKLSPAFLGAVKGGSPAVFALLASPQFLIGTGIAVGMTVVLFGGWKIVKKMNGGASSPTAAGGNSLSRRQSMAMRSDGYHTHRGSGSRHGGSHHGSSRRHGSSSGSSGGRHHQHRLPPSARQNLLPAAGPGLGGRAAPATLMSDGFDEALVLEEELSSIESWRRGIMPSFELDGAVEQSEADAELISPEAMRTRMSNEEQRRASAPAPRNRASSESGSRRSHHGGSGSGSGSGSGKHRHGSSSGSASGRRASSSSHKVDVPERSSSSRAFTTSKSSAASSLPAALSVRLKDKSGNGNMLKQLFKKKEKDSRKEPLAMAVAA